MNQPPAGTFVFNMHAKSVAFLQRYTPFEEAVVEVAHDNKTRQIVIPLNRFQFTAAPPIGTETRPLNGNGMERIVDYDVAGNRVIMANHIYIPIPVFINEWEYAHMTG